MKSYRMQMTDTATLLELREVDAPAPGEGQLLVRIRAASLNRGEFLRGHGAKGAKDSQDAKGSNVAQADAWKPVGGEGAGEVVAVGAGITAFKPGDRVMGRCAGSFSEMALMEAAESMAMPATLNFEQGASIPLAFMVAFDMLVTQGRLAVGEWLLVNGVSSGVGVASLQLGKALGAKVIGTSGSADKLSRHTKRSF